MHACMYVYYLSIYLSIYTYRERERHTRAQREKQEGERERERERDSPKSEYKPCFVCWSSFVVSVLPVPAAGWGAAEEHPQSL